MKMLFKSKTTKNQVAFTLVELLIVIAIVSILAAVVVIAINPTQLLKQARDKKRVTDLLNMQKAFSLYALDNAQYPNEVGPCDSSIGTDTDACPPDGAELTFQWYYTADTIVGQLTNNGKYLGKMPTDPLNNITYYYYYEPDCGAPDCPVGICCQYSLGCNYETDTRGFVWSYRNVKY